MTEFYNIVYREQKVIAPMRPGFWTTDVESLDAPSASPAGSTKAYSDFHTTSIIYRHGG